MIPQLIAWLSGDPGMKALNVIHSVELDTVLPLWLFPFLAAALSVLVFFAYQRVPNLTRRQRIILTALRSLAYIVLLFLLFYPKIRVEGEGMTRGMVPMVFDATKSMGIKDIEGGHRRIEAALDAGMKIQTAGGEDAKVMLMPFSAGLELKALDMTDPKNPPEIKLEADSTNIGGMLDSALAAGSSADLSGMILLSDGAGNMEDTIGNTIASLKRRNIPVYAVGTASPSPRDAEIRAMSLDDVVFVNEKVRADVILAQSGYTGQKAKLNLTIQDEKGKSSPLARTEKTFAQPGPMQASSEFIIPRTGVFQIRAELAQMPGEVSSENNVAVKNIRVIDEKIRVLMLFGTPSWEYRYLIGAMERDQRVKFHCWLTNADERLFRSSPINGNFLKTPPTSGEELSKKYDLVILSRVDSTRMPAGLTRGLADFVEKFGGGLVVAADPTFIPYTLKGTPLEPLMPVTIPSPAGRTYRDELFASRAEEFRFSVTEEGESDRLVLFSADPKENARIWSGMPPVYDGYRAGKLKPSAVTLLVSFRDSTRGSIPAIVRHSYGRGEVLFMGFDSTWRWRREYGDKFFRNYWGKTVQYLGIPHLLKESAQSMIYAGNENASVGDRIPIRARVLNPDFSQCREDAVTLSVVSGESKMAIQLKKVSGREGVYKGEIEAKEPGTCTLSLEGRYGAQPVELRVLPSRREFQNAELNRDYLEKICKETGGQYFSMEDASKLFETLMSRRPVHTLTASIPLWNSLLMLLAAAGCLIAEWVFRKLYCLD